MSPNVAEAERSPAELQAEAGQIALDIQMLVFAAGELAGVWQTPAQPAAGHRERMAMECFLLHFRNLAGFLGLRAADYGARLDAGMASLLMDDYLRAEQIIGSDACAGEAVCTRHDVARMVALMEEALQHCFGSLEAEKLAWFLSDEHTVNALSFMEPLIPMLGNFPAAAESPGEHTN